MLKIVLVIDFGIRNKRYSYKVANDEANDGEEIMEKENQNYEERYQGGKRMKTKVKRKARGRKEARRLDAEVIIKEVSQNSLHLLVSAACSSQPGNSSNSWLTTKADSSH